MPENLQPLNFLYTIENERVEDVHRACALLPQQPATDFLERLLVQKEQKLGPERFDAIIQIAAEAVRSHEVQCSISDWPFEHFWQNQNEPRHSRILGYFIDHNFDHGCGEYLMGKLFETLKLEDLPNDKWHVEIESRHIDILLTRDCIPGKYAIIIETK